MSRGQRHLISCRCVLPQFKNVARPVNHRFSVFSVIEDDWTVRLKYAQCVNCKRVHKVTDVCKSEIVEGKENMPSMMTIDDLSQSLPAPLSSLLSNNNVDLSTWEMAKFIYENERWGEYVLLSTDEDSGVKIGKYVMILGKNMFKVEQFSRNEVLL